MRDAIVADAAALPGIELACVQGPGVPRAAAGGSVELRPGESLLDLVRREALHFDRVWVVAPETDGCLLALAQAVDAGRWMGCRPAAIRLCSSKRATLAHLTARGIATPLAIDEDAARWVVKPDDGAGSVETQVHGTREAAAVDVAARMSQGRAATLEPWVEGEALSLSLFLRKDAGEGCAAELLSVNRQHITVGSSGTLAYRGVDILAIGPADTRHAALRDTAAAVARAVPGLRGFVGIDLVWHERCGPVVIEINPRLTCAYAGLSSALGRNLAGEMLALHDHEARAHARA
ncbi:MAG: ATP-grasp domain-containing protein [Methylibium sp.]|nr:ATP-grasp domain-containing protein [Methylibium sp.]